MTELVGHYTDHLMSDPYSMAVQSSLAKAKAQELADQGLLLLTTCLRVELYGTRRQVEQVTPQLLGEPRAVLPTSIEVGRRLAEIAAGVHSQILGEGHIAHQVGQALQALRPGLPIRRLAELALAVGRAAQQCQSFHAATDYEQIVCTLVDGYMGQDHRGQTLYLVGAGMIGRSLLLSDLPARFSMTRVVSRDPKRLRKKLRGMPLPTLDFIRPEVVALPRERDSVFVIATSEVTDQYAASLERLIDYVEPRAIIELSSLPVLSAAYRERESYTNMYSPRFLKCVEANNRALARRIGAVREDIFCRLENAISHYEQRTA